MAIDTSIPRSRRALLAGGIGGAVALAASALGRPLEAAAAEPYVGLGQANTAAATTSIRVTTTANPAFKADATQNDGIVGLTAASGYAGVHGYTSRNVGYGVYGGGPLSWGYLGAGMEGVGGHSGPGRGVYGSSDSGYGVYGDSTSGNGVYGASASGYGVYGDSGSGIAIRGRSSSNYGVVGYSASASKAAILGWSNGESTGVLGYSGKSAPPAAPAKTGVYGYVAEGGTGVRGEAATGSGLVGVSTSGFGIQGVTGSGEGVFGSSTSSVGVHGESTSGPGVLGTSSTSHGVHGKATAGRGVYGQATSGTGLYGYATTGYAVRGSGRIRFDRASGVATIRATKSSITVTPGIDVTAASFVLLTPRADLGTRRLWYTTNTTANTITIRVSSVVTGDLAVGWLLVG